VSTIGIKSSATATANSVRLDIFLFAIKLYFINIMVR
jgi:hypothetical protein